jgi:hypothetical protein
MNMRKLKDVLRLKLVGGQSHQEIATGLGIAKGSVTKYTGLAASAGLDWGAIDAMSETDLEQRLFGCAFASTFARPDYGRMHQELRRKGVTLMLLWQEYSAQVGEEHCEQSPLKALRYSQFSENYRQFAKRLKRSMRLVHRAGEKMFIDYAGPTIALMVHGQEVGRVTSSRIVKAQATKSRNAKARCQAFVFACRKPDLQPSGAVIQAVPVQRSAQIQLGEARPGAVGEIQR